MRLKALFLAAFLLLFGTVAHAQDNPKRLDDAMIFAIFDQANMADIWTARLGIQKGKSGEVRALGKMVAGDHEVVQQMGRDLARKLGITPRIPDNDRSFEDQAQVIKRLQARSGADFDHAYLQHEIQFHTAVIAALEKTLIPKTKTPELKALLVGVLPGFKHHLAATKEAAAMLNAAKME